MIYIPKIYSHLFFSFQGGHPCNSSPEIPLVRLASSNWVLVRIDWVVVRLGVGEGG